MFFYPVLGSVPGIFKAISRISPAFSQHFLKVRKEADCVLQQ
jgi:hypothetical protein